MPRCGIGVRYAIAGFAALGASVTIAQSTEPKPGGEITITRKIDDADKKVCKAGTATGSIMRTKVCKSKFEWEVERERQMTKHEKAIDDQETRRNTCAMLGKLC